MGRYLRFGVREHGQCAISVPLSWLSRCHVLLFAAFFWRLVTQCMFLCVLVLFPAVMAAVSNGLAAYGALIPFAGTFLNFIGSAGFRFVFCVSFFSLCVCVFSFSWCVFPSVCPCSPPPSSGFKLRPWLMGWNL